MRKPRSSSGGFKETIKTLVYAILIALFVRTVAFEPFNIPSGSMIPTLLVGDYLFVSKFSYGYSRFSLPFSPPLFEGRIFAKEPERGDVVVFRPASQPDTDFVKRLIGLPGDRIQISKGLLYINDEPVQRRQIEDYVYRDERDNTLRLKQYMETLPNGRSYPAIYNPETESRRPYPGFDPNNTGVYVVPEGHYFMMGDNRDRSNDSRFLNEVGYVPADNLIGRAEILWFSTDGSARLWEFWGWPGATRFERILAWIN